jgi:hypothetical protein
LGGARPDEETVNLDPFDLHVLGSVTSGRIKSEEPLSGSLGAELPEEEVAKIAVSSGTTTAPVSAVELEEGWIIVDCEVWLRGVGTGELEGSLVLRNGALVFRAERVEAFGRLAPKRLIQGLLRGVDFSPP